jgi:hypothetical protein
MDNVMDAHSFNLTTSALSSVMPQAMAEKVSNTQRLLRKTYEAVCEITTTDTISVQLSAFLRFRMLELQAHNARLDFEVIEKTSASRLVALSEAYEFRLPQYHRFFTTFGDDFLKAGKLVFIYLKHGAD